MRFWDSSAITPLLIEEPASESMVSLIECDPEMLVWWGARVECVSALARRERENHLSLGDVTGALALLNSLSSAWHEVVPAGAVRRRAERLLRVHPLRAADALQLAAAITATDDGPAQFEFVSLDQRLNEAAQREGLLVVAS